MTYLALAIFLVCLAIAAQLTLGLRRVVRLEEWSAEPGSGPWPRVSVIVPARNEQRHIEAALQSLLRLDYPDFEIIAVDDRSTDRTGEILNQLAVESSCLQVMHVLDLPPGWLGKNHALTAGASRATGQWLLFADADISMAPDTLRRAVRYAQSNQLHHLALTPAIVMPTLLLRSMVVTFVTVFCIYFQPWKARDPRSKRSMGVGAFNLIRRIAYWQVGGHEAIRMRPDDDLMLGKLIKSHGFRQEAASGVGLISVPWYGSLREVFVGLEKNAFSGFEYSVATVVAGSAAALLLFVWPFVAVLVTHGAAQWLYVATCVVLWALCGQIAAWMRLPRRTGLAFPLCAVLLVAIQWRAMLLTLKNRGIRWRDTHYPLDELKANRISGQAVPLGTWEIFEMQVDSILPTILVGACPRSRADIDQLKARFGVTAVLNLQTEEDLQCWQIDWPEMAALYGAAGLVVQRCPVRDFDPTALRENLPQCVQQLRTLLEAGHTVYVHCNAGINRSPTTIIAYLHWVERRELGEAVWLVTSRHACDPWVHCITEAAGSGAGTNVNSTLP